MNAIQSTFMLILSAFLVYFVVFAIIMAATRLYDHNALKARHKEELEVLRKRDLRRYQTLLALCERQGILKYDLLKLVEEMEKDDSPT